MDSETEQALKQIQENFKGNKDKVIDKLLQAGMLWRCRLSVDGGFVLTCLCWYSSWNSQTSGTVFTYSYASFAHKVLIL